MTPYLLINGWNCLSLSHGARQSVENQTIKPRVIVVDDGSTDGSGDVWRGFDVIRIEKRRGAAFARFIGLKRICETADPDDVICLLDMDDRLLPGAIETAMNLHQKGAWATYGGMVSNIRHHTDQGEYSEQVRRDRSYRSAGFRAQPFRTFRAKLVQDMPESLFIMDGQWIQACTDLALMFYVLEQCEFNRVSYITEPVYHYNMTNRAFSSYRRVNSNQRGEIRKWIKNGIRTIYLHRNKYAMNLTLRQPEGKAGLALSMMTVQ